MLGVCWAWVLGYEMGIGAAVVDDGVAMAMMPPNHSFVHIIAVQP